MSEDKFCPILATKQEDIECGSNCDLYTNGTCDIKGIRKALESIAQNLKALNKPPAPIHAEYGQ